MIVMDKERLSEPVSDELGVASYYWEANRLKTFTTWPFDKNFKCNPAKMAEAGFYACGGSNETDLAKCFFCEKELDGWEPDDDPWSEHKKHSKRCVFLTYGRPEADLTVLEHLDLIKMYYTSIIEKTTDALLQKCEKEVAEVLESLKSGKS